MKIPELSLYAVWFGLLVNLALTLRIVGWVRRVAQAHDRPHESHSEQRSELLIGRPAPAFRARTLDGLRVSERSFVGQNALFVFSSTGCGGCRTMLGELELLNGTAGEISAAQVRLVVDVGAEKTQGWLDTVEKEDGVRVTVPVLVAPRSQTPFHTDYNPRGFYPYFCFVDREGVVRSRGVVGHDEWQDLTRQWAPAPAPNPVGSRAPLRTQPRSASPADDI